MDCVKKTVADRGFFGLYRGLSVLVYGSIPKSAVRYVFYYCIMCCSYDLSKQVQGRSISNSRGISPTCAHFIIFCRFGGFEQIKLQLVDENGNLSGSGKLLAGLGAGVLEAIFAVTPMETVKVKFIADQRSANPKFKGFFHGVSHIVKAEGISGVYKGVTATIMKQGSNQAIRFYVMESLREMYKGGDKNKECPKLLVGCFGAVAGAASVFGNTPL